MQNSVHIKYVLLIGRDVTRGKHHVMKSSSFSFRWGSKGHVIFFPRGGRRPGFEANNYSAPARTHIINKTRLGTNTMDLAKLAVIVSLTLLSVQLGKSK